MLFIARHARQPVADIPRATAHGHAGQGIKGVFRHIGQHLAQPRFHKEQGRGDGRRHAVAGFGMGEGLGIGPDEVPAEPGVLLRHHALVIARCGLARRGFGEKAPHIQLAHFPAHGRLAGRGGQRGQQRVHSRPGQSVSGQTFGQRPPHRGQCRHSVQAFALARRNGQRHGLRERFRQTAACGPRDGRRGSYLRATGGEQNAEGQQKTARARPAAQTLALTPRPPTAHGLQLLKNPDDPSQQAPGKQIGRQ